MLLVDQHVFVALPSSLVCCHSGPAPALVVTEGFIRSPLSGRPLHQLPLIGGFPNCLQCLWHEVEHRLVALALLRLDAMWAKPALLTIAAALLAGIAEAQLAPSACLPRF